jgi:hypothetical protein
MAAGGGEAQTRATEREMTQRLFLRDLEGKGISFYSLLEEQKIHEGIARRA